MNNTSQDGRQHECGGRYSLVTEPATVLIRGTEVTAAQTRYRCDRCGEERLTSSQIDEWEKAVYELLEASPGRKGCP